MVRYCEICGNRLRSRIKYCSECRPSGRIRPYENDDNYNNSILRRRDDEKYLIAFGIIAFMFIFMGFKEVRYFILGFSIWIGLIFLSGFILKRKISRENKLREFVVVGGTIVIGIILGLVILLGISIVESDKFGLFFVNEEGRELVEDCKLRVDNDNLKYNEFPVYITNETSLINYYNERESTHDGPGLNHDYVQRLFSNARVLGYPLVLFDYLERNSNTLWWITPYGVILCDGESILTV
jgi:hypothetical protein